VLLFRAPAGDRNSPVVRAPESRPRAAGIDVAGMGGAGMVGMHGLAGRMRLFSALAWIVDHGFDAVG